MVGWKCLPGMPQGRGQAKEEDGVAKPYYFLFVVHSVLSLSSNLDEYLSVSPESTWKATCDTFTIASFHTDMS